MANRIKGQECTLIVTSRAGTEEALGDVKSASVEFQLDILSEQLLGETSDRKDDLFRGMKVSFECQLESSDALRVVDKIKRKSQRRRGSETESIGIIMTLAFPDGTRPRIMIPDLAFGNIPLNIGGRADYVTLSFEAEASDADVLYT